MSLYARGHFPGRQRKKTEKKRLKFKPNLYKLDLDDLKVTCSFITNISRQFHLIFEENLVEVGSALYCMYKFVQFKLLPLQYIT